MLPIVFRVPGWVPLLAGQPVTSFGVLLLVAILAGGAWLARELARSGVPRATAWDLVVVAAVGGLVGAKLFHLALHPDAWTEGLSALAARSGLNGIGALAGVVAVGAWRARAHGLALPRVAGAAAPGLALAYGIGRVGSFLAGTEYGHPTSSVLGVAFRRGAPATTPANLADAFGVTAPPDAIVGDHVLVHPTQLYEAGAAFALFAVLTRWRRGGARFGAFLVLAGMLRFAVDFLHVSRHRGAGPFTADQLVCAVVVAAGFVILARSREPEPDAPC